MEKACRNKMQSKHLSAMQQVKLSNEHDLFRIRTLGFRGEALASIASVSKIDLWTSDGESTGTEVHIDGGQLVKHENAAFRKGTDILCRNYFFNTPARLKIYENNSNRTWPYDWSRESIGAKPSEIAFKLTHYSQVLLQTSGSGDQLRVLSDIYGMAAARKMVPFKGENADYAVYGLCHIT